MSYEYSSESRRLDAHKPFRVENMFLSAGGAIQLFGRLLLLLVLQLRFFFGRGEPRSLTSEVEGEASLLPALAFVASLQRRNLVQCATVNDDGFIFLCKLRFRIRQSHLIYSWRII